MMGVDRGRDDNRVYLGIIDNVALVLRESNVRILYSQFSASLGLDVAANDDLAVRSGVEVPNKVRTPIAQADDTYFDFQGTLP
jgi:hypothetical protein